MHHMLTFYFTSFLKHTLVALLALTHCLVALLMVLSSEFLLALTSIIKTVNMGTMTKRVQHNF